eukprot:4352351-Amphidinium_carterae.3
MRTNDAVPSKARCKDVRIPKDVNSLHVMQTHTLSTQTNAITILNQLLNTALTKGLTELDPGLVAQKAQNSKLSVFLYMHCKEDLCKHKPRRTRWPKEGAAFVSYATFPANFQDDDLELQPVKPPHCSHNKFRFKSGGLRSCCAHPLWLCPREKHIEAKDSAKHQVKGGKESPTDLRP